MIKNPFSLSFPHFTLSNKSKLSVTFPRKSGFFGENFQTFSFNGVATGPSPVQEDRRPAMAVQPAGDGG